MTPIRMRPATTDPGQPGDDSIERSPPARGCSTSALVFKGPWGLTNMNQAVFGVQGNNPAAAGVQQRERDA